MVNTGKALRIAMAANNLKNIDLATKMKVSPVQVSYWRSRDSISMSTIIRLAEIFHMKASEFIALGEQMFETDEEALAFVAGTIIFCVVMWSLYV